MMTATKKRWCAVWLMFVLPGLVLAGAPSVRPVVWSPHTEVSCHMNMGPTGARAWMRGYHFQVAAVDPGSPADGVLQPGDMVLGAGSTQFSAEGDSRITLGTAIGEAEAKDGALTLTIRRDDRTQCVTVNLPTTGSYAATWPYGCAKSQRILHEACTYLLEAQFPDGSVVTDGNFGTFLSGLLLLAAGDPRFMDGARRAAYATAALDFEKIEYHCWAMGYGGLLLAEYYLATGDGTVLPKLKEITDHLARGQMQCGSWGHSAPSGGYGALNQLGIICAITMSLAQECGVEVDRAALRRAVSFYGRYADLGAVPYGDHLPAISWPDDNGKNASAAVLCALNPGWEDALPPFAHSVAMSYWLRETGHTGGLFSMLWGPLACTMAGAAPFKTFMDYQAWYYNLCRTWRGELVLLPYHEALTRFDSSSYIESGGEFTTGGLGLVFALPYRKLRILGAPRSVFGAAIDGSLLKARDCYQARQWTAFGEAVGTAKAAAPTAEQTRWLAQLEEAAAMVRATTTRTRQEIENNIAENDPCRAVQQLEALKRFLGDKDETILALAQRVKDTTPEWMLQASKEYYPSWNKLRAFSYQSWLPYGAQAKRLVGEVPPLRPRFWTPLVPASTSNMTWKTAADKDPIAGSCTFDLATMDYRALRIQVQSPGNSHITVSLNGTKVAEIVRGMRSGYAKIELDAHAVSLLKTGGNVIDISGSIEGKNRNALGLGLDAVVPERPLTATPARADIAPLAPLPEALSAVLERARNTYATMPVKDTPTPAIPDRLCVSDSMDRFNAALNAACDAMDADAVQQALRSPVAYWRHLAGQTLARRGVAGMPIITTGLSDTNWRVRSASCDALSFVQNAAGKTNAAVTAALTAPALVATLTGLVADENAWVRCRAASALASIGQPDDAAAAALGKACADPDPWVRDAALAAIHKVTGDSSSLIRAAGEALQVPSSSAATFSRALRLIQQYGATNTALIPALVFALDHPGEGGGEELNQAMNLLHDSDPGGTRAVPAIAKVAAGGYAYDRLKGAPRKTAIELLGKMGPKATAAVPVLNTIIAGTNEKEKELRDAARTALGLITVP